MTLDYVVKVKRSRRKTGSIYIERDGSVSVLVPESMDDAQVEALLKQYEYRIHKYQAKRQLLNEAAVIREAVNGQAFLYLGRNYYLQFSPEIDQVVFRGRYLYAPPASNDDLREMFRVFYRNRGLDFIVPRVQRFAESMGVQVDTVAIIELKNRWASCSVKRPKVNFHWKVMMAPGSVVNYLIVHELAHLKHRRHDASFWNEVDRVLPDYQKQVAWLKQYGAGLSV